MDDFQGDKSSDVEQFVAGLLDKDTRIVISFDGGGIRGVMSALIAEALEEAAGVPLPLASDLLIGTSTGGIISLLFSLPREDNPKLPKYTAAEVAKLYYDFGKSIFSAPLKEIMESLWGLDKCKYPDHAIDKIMEDHFKDTPMSESVTPVAVVGCEIERYIPLLLKSYHPPNVLMKDAAVATSAAPTYFPVAHLKTVTQAEETVLEEENNDEYFVVDGGISSANNPALLGYVEACDIYKNVKDIKEKIIIISIGTGITRNTIYHKNVAEGGKLAWIPYILPLFTAMANEVTDYQLDILLRDVPIKGKTILRRYWRFQPIVPKELLSMDHANDTNLMGLTNLTKAYIEENKRDIEFLGKILSRRAQYLKK